MRQHGSFRCQLFDPVKCFAQRKMAGMRVVLQRIYDQNGQAPKAGSRFLREGADIRAVCKGANTEAQRDYIAVDLGQRLKGEGTPLSFDYHREVMPDHMRLQNRRVRTARRCFETVAEALPQAGECRPVGMDVDEAPL